MANEIKETKDLKKMSGVERIITASEIIDTKDAGYKYINAQQNTKLGIDITPAPVTPFVYTSTNALDYTKNVERNEEVKYPLDESGGITITVSKTTSITQNTDFNELNPTHDLLNKIDLNEDLGINIPIRVEDGPSNAYFEAFCNIVVDSTKVGGETRSMSITYNIVGSPEWKDMTTDAPITK